MTLSADGQEVARAAIPGSYTEFTSASVPLTLKAGEHEIELPYALAQARAADGRAVKALQFARE